MPSLTYPTEPPPADGPTDVEVARYIVARCHELEKLTDYLGNPEVERLLREAREKAQEILDSDGKSGAT